MDLDTADQSSAFDSDCEVPRMKKKISKNIRS